MCTQIGNLPSVPTPADCFEDLFPSSACNGFYLDEDGEEVFFSILPDDEAPLDQITKYSEAELTQLARVVSDSHRYYLASCSDSEKAHHVLLAHAFGIKVKPSKNSTLTGLVDRLGNAKWWRRSINKLADERREHLAQIGGKLGKRARQQCCSEATIEVMRTRKEKTTKYLEGKYKVMTKTRGFEKPTVFSLLDVAKAQEVNRINELFLDIKALEKIANDRGWGWMFITLTAEPKYHSSPAMGKNSYDSALNARAANNSIAEDWRAIGGALKEQSFKPGVNYFGFRVTEVHDDGCPHWHVLLFFECGVLAVVERTIRRLYRNRPVEYFNKNKENIIRVGRAKEDELSATPASYIYNYLAFALSGGSDGDGSSNTAYKYQCALRAMGARQFQFFGIKGARGKLRALSKVKRQKNCPENIRVVADLVHVDKDVENRKQIQLEARVGFLLGGSDELEFIKQNTVNSFGELVERNVGIKHKSDQEGVTIYGLCEDIEKSAAEAIIGKQGQ